MDYVNYSPVNTSPASFAPAVGASLSTPKTLLHAHTGVTYVSTGGAWAAACQDASGSVYSGYSTLPASTQAAVVTNLSTAPAALPAKSLNAATVLVRGR
jgi:hypothetical protein